MVERKPTIFILRNDGNPSYTIKGPSKRLYLLKGGEPFDVMDFRDIEYFKGRNDICYIKGQKPHDATMQQKSYTKLKPSIKEMLLSRHTQEKIKRDTKASKLVAPAVEQEKEVKPKPESVKKIKKIDTKIVKDEPKEAKQVSQKKKS